jgi:hypothetical protein
MTTRPGTHKGRVERDLYGGLSGLELEPASYDLGKGIVLSKTYAHLMSHFVMAFHRAAPGKPHPGPWKDALGRGVAVDIAAELFVPADCDFENFDNLNLLWWIASLLRLRVAATIGLPVVSSHSFASIPSLREEPQISTFEVSGLPLRAEAETNNTLTTSKLDWLKAHWQRAGALFSNEDFNAAFVEFDFSTRSPSLPLGLVALWGALERLFATSEQELSFRVSANIAAYLEPPSAGRYDLFKKVRKLYDHRSRAAHGNPKYDIVPFQETYAIARRALIKIIESHHLPTKAELEALVFGS